MPAFAQVWRERAYARRAIDLRGAKSVAWIEIIAAACLLVVSGWTVQAATENDNPSARSFRPSPEEEAQRLADEANIAYTSGDYARAAQVYTQLLDMKPADARVFFNRANSYSKLRDGDRALNDYSTALQIAPSFVPALVNRGSLFLRRKQFVEALADFDRAAALRPADGLIAYHRGVAFARSGQRQLAAQALDRAIELASGFAPARAERGFVYLASGDADGAAEQFKAALTLEPANARARAGMQLVGGHAVNPSVDGANPLDERLAGEFAESAHGTCFTSADDSDTLAAAVGKLKWRASPASSAGGTRTWRLASPFGRGKLVYVSPGRSPRNAVCAVTVDGVTSKFFREIQAVVARRYGGDPSVKRGKSASESSQYRVPHGDTCEVTVSLHGSPDEGRFTVRMSHEQKRPADL